MHCIEDKKLGIVINHSSDWSGEVRIAWYKVEERRDPGPTPPSLRETWCLGKDLVRGRFSDALPPRRESSPHTVPGSWIPTEVLTRVVALAVESYIMHRLTSFAEQLSVGELEP